MRAAEHIRVYLVDDHPVVMAGVSQLLTALEGIEVIGSAPSGEAALPELERLRPDVLIVDHQLGSGMSGIDLCRVASAPPYEIRCLALTASLEPRTLQAFVDAGALGFILKRSDLALLEQAVHKVASGASFLDPELATLMMIHMGSRTTSGLEALSARERDVLRLLSAGMSNPEIADQLVVSLSSVKGYVAGVLRKLGVRHRAEAAVLAARAGLLGEDRSSDGK